MGRKIHLFKQLPVEFEFVKNSCVLFINFSDSEHLVLALDFDIFLLLHMFVFF